MRPRASSSWTVPSCEQCSNWKNCTESPGVVAWLPRDDEGGNMACACSGGATQVPRNDEQEFVVKAPNGTKTVVKGETNAKIEATMVGGTYSAR
jgi:hypothetical protein